MKTFRISLFFLLAISAICLNAARVKPAASLEEALKDAEKKKKLVFVIAGREQCPNCKLTKEQIYKGKVSSIRRKAIVVELNIDDPQDKKWMMDHGTYGRTLPLITIVDFKERPLASTCGYKKNPRDYDKLIKDADKKAKKLISEDKKKK